MNHSMMSWPPGRRDNASLNSADCCEGRLGLPLTDTRDRLEILNNSFTGNDFRSLLSRARVSNADNWLTAGGILESLLSAGAINTEAD